MAHGSCLCGKVTYEAEIPIDPETSKPRATHLCHCRTCRKITGASTSVNVDIPAEKFKVTSGEAKTFRGQQKDAGFEFTLSFCGNCGTPLYAVPHLPGWEDKVIIQVGSLDDGDTIMSLPAFELNIAHRPGWITQVAGADQKPDYG